LNAHGAGAAGGSCGARRRATIVLAHALAALALSGAAACGPHGATGGSGADTGGGNGALTGAGISTGRSTPAVGGVPERLASCHGCHRSIVESFLGHAMADSLGPVGDPPRGTVINARSGMRYDYTRDADATLLTATAANGGQRRQRVVGRIGAGLIDRSYVAVELEQGGPPSDRLQFAPVESVTGHGLALSPFEHDPRPAGLDQPVTARCLGCHTTRPVRGPSSGASGVDYPRNLLGRDMLGTLPPLDCTACHGGAERHVAIMQERATAAPDDIGITQIGDLAAPAQRDVCARCHLEGDAHLELAESVGYGPRATPLAGALPVLVPARTVEDHRLVSQLERLTLSACFRGSPGMTCTTCHEPHSAVATQGTGAFEAACVGCHAQAEAVCSRDVSLAVKDVTGEPARGPAGCVDCHVRRSQPFDVPGLRTADHFVRRTIARPASPAARHVADPGGPLMVHDDGRLAPLIATPDGARWASGLVGLGYVQQGRMPEAAERLAAFPPPGTPEARRPTAPDGLTALETSADFHHLRGLVLEAVGDPVGARAAYTDALLCDAAHPEARLNRGLLRLLAGEIAGCVEDAEALLALHPQADKGWNLLARAQARLGNLQAAAHALQQSVQAWPADPGTWHELGRLRLTLGDPAAARLALQRARALQPSRPGLADDLAATGAR
jgi:predicted CXXCH cytochrome family protein